MTNEYGIPLDRNGYAPSILNRCENECFICHRNGASDPLNRHEVFHGPYRDKSKHLGLWVNLCHESCHQGRTGVHGNGNLDLWLKARAQDMAMEYYGWTVDEFRERFGRSYIDEFNDAVRNHP